MAQQRVFNHVGLVVTDLPRARRFYEELLGFTYWWEFEVPDDQAAPVLRVAAPMGMTAVYLVQDSFVLELMHFAAPGAQAQRQERVMNEPGLTHISIATDDLDELLTRVPDYGGEVLQDTRNEMVAFIRDPDGQLLEVGTMGWRDALPPLPQPGADRR